MSGHAYILDWTMDDYAGLKAALTSAGFDFQKEETSESIRVEVPFERVETFARLCQTHLNVPYNYVDIQYPDHQKTIVIFQQHLYVIGSQEENERVQTWAIAQGLPPAQAEWGTSFPQDH